MTGDCIYHREIPEDLHNTKHEVESRASERSAETRCDVVQVDLWVAITKETEGGKEGVERRWQRGRGEAAAEGERPCLCRRSAARFTVTGTDSGGRTNLT